MEPIISIEFEYRHKIYFALVRIKEKQPKEYRVTIMNGSLEQRLYGHHIFVEEQGAFITDPIQDKETEQLRQAVGMALCKHYNLQYTSEKSYETNKTDNLPKGKKQ
jgi:hypothetical protein